MDDIRKERAENLDKYLIGPDDKFQFKCVECGKCCKDRDDIILTTRDLHNIARKLGLTMKDVVEKYCETYIGPDSRVPIVRLLPRGRLQACPLLQGQHCSVHDAKPAVCAMYPLGRVVKFQPDNLPLRADYILQPVSCGSRTRTHTVRSWLEKFGIPVEDEFYVLWNETVFYLREYLHKREEEKQSAEVMDILWHFAFWTLYEAYDTNEELLPRFQQNTSRLKQLLSELEADMMQLESKQESAGGA